MFKAFMRLLAMVMLAITVIMAVLDATRSIAADRLVLTPLGTSWNDVAPTLLGQIETLIDSRLPAFVLDPLFTGLLSAPGFAVFAVLALLFALAGRPGRARPGGLAWQR